MTLLNSRCMVKQGKIMRKHFFPDWPVMICMGSNIEPVINIFFMQYSTQPFIIRFADVLICRAQHNTQSPQISVLILRNKIDGTIKIDILVVIAIHELPDIKSAAHGKAITGHLRMSKSKINRMVSSKTTS